MENKELKGKRFFLLKDGRDLNILMFDMDEDKGYIANVNGEWVEEDRETSLALRVMWAQEPYFVHIDEELAEYLKTLNDEELAKAWRKLNPL